MWLNQRILILVAILISLKGYAQPAEYRMSGEDYINKFKEEAVKEMLVSGVPASITLAQAMLESGNGNSPLAVYANNHFGIKCHNDWNGPTFTLDDDAKNECFRKYRHVLESYKDHSSFLQSKQRYQALFELEKTDYKSWAYGLKKAGYATNPRYPELLIKIIEEYKLYQLDKHSNLSAPINSPVKTEKKNNGKILPRQEILIKNNIKYIIAKPGDTYESIAERYDIRKWQIKKYNDLKSLGKLQVNQAIYLQPKRNKAEVSSHTVAKGETLHSISQLYGIKLKKLCKYNQLEEETKVKVGETIKLTRKRRS